MSSLLYTVRFKHAEQNRNVVLEWEEEDFARHLANAITSLEEIEGSLWDDILKMAFEKLKAEAIREMNRG